MKKNHVGRPTNEEIRKRKVSVLVKMICISVLVILGILAIINVNMDSLMGAYVGCHTECESNEWIPDNNSNVCYKKNISKSSVDAYMLADAEIENNPNVIDSSDYQIMENDVKNNIKLDKRKKLIYDLNSDGVINQEDLTKFEDSLSSYNTTGISPNFGYVCPETEEIKEVDDLGQTIITRVEYKKNGTKCDVETTVRIEIPGKQVCSGGMLTGKGNSSKSNSSYKRSDYSSTGYPSTKSSNSNTSKKKTSSKSKKTSIYKSNNGSYKPKKGDIVFFSNNNIVYYHVGIVYKVSGNTIYTIEGNEHCVQEGQDSYCKASNTCKCKDGARYSAYWMRHSRVSKEKHNYRSDNNVAGFINMAKVATRSKAKKMADLAHKQIGKKGNKYWKNTKVWNNTIADWCAIFVAWNLEQKNVKPSKTGWSASCTAWVGSAKKIKK